MTDSLTTTAGSDATNLFIGGAVVLVLSSATAFVLRDPAIRQACGRVLNDPELQTVGLEAIKNVGRETVAAWKRNGGPEAIAGFVTRLAGAGA